MSFKSVVAFIGIVSLVSDLSAATKFAYLASSNLDQ